MGFITDPEAKITGRGGCVKSKRFWFFELVEDSGRVGADG